MSSYPSMQVLLLFLFLLLPLFSSFAQAAVPQNETFQFVNEGEFGPYVVEYDGNYRPISVFNSPFQLCFYNTTPNAYTLALRMATTRSESLFRWVWEANRSKPVRENATLTFGTNGNLVLAEANGKIAWQTNTANKGVVGFKLLPNGNMVLYDSKGKFIWQSFDYPTDTLLVGQTLRGKLVSRLSEQVNANGPYIFVLEPKGWSLYYKSSNSAKPLLYFSLAQRFGGSQGPLEAITLAASYDTNQGATEVTLESKVNGSSAGNFILGRPKYNGTLSIMRLGIDGNVKVFTYYDPVDYRAWEATFTLFDRDSIWESECQLPERCGNLGVCEDNQCVACPSVNGLVGWSKKCEAKKVTSCSVKDFGYYKVEGVDHFLSKYTRGSAVKLIDCGSKCSKDCKCLGYFYNQETSRCWIAYELKTLTKVENSTRVGYIKVPNK